MCKEEQYCSPEIKMVEMIPEFIIAVSGNLTDYSEEDYSYDDNFWN